VKWARGRLELSQAALAEMVGTSLSAIGNVESGARQRPRALLALADALKVPARWLQDGTGQAPEDLSPEEVARAKQSRQMAAVRELGEMLARHSPTRRRTLADLLARLAESPESAELAEELAAFLQPPR